jgi:tetratricopeptide (TPR) repeat protein
MLRVEDYSRAAVRLANQSLLRLDQNTTLTFTLKEPDRPMILKLLRGVVHFFSTFPREMMVVTPFVNGGVEGTEFLTRVSERQSTILVMAGQVRASNPAGSVQLGPGDSAEASPGKAPIRRTIVNPRDAVDWALYYPPVLSFQTIEPDLPSSWQTRLRRSMDLTRHGLVSQALAEIEPILEQTKLPDLLAYRAALLLFAGRVAEAGRDIELALSRQAGNSPALALKSIIALTKGKKATAAQLAKQALQTDSVSIPGRLALSYACQADFRIDQALEALSPLVNQDSAQGLVLARHAELQLAQGHLPEARRTAQRAAALEPDLARTQTVLGFIHLASLETRQAKEAFARSISLDQADPLPRLGRGLARIRTDDLRQGRADIETAASLDPNSSLIRSYLGKAYYEEKRNSPAAEQLALAKQLDPADPTPWLYDAVRKQSVNRPVPALKDLRRSIELNDNRAVYRSRLLLDQDLAARTAGLARIYQDLGFQRLALLEGWKSVATAPTQSAAHQLLSDVYSTLPRHEIARVSERLQAQLLQPPTNAPLPPQLSQSGLQVLDDTGPAEPGFNEYTSLFTRERIRFRADGVAGEHDTLGDNLILSGMRGAVSGSLGQYHYQTDGFRTNNDLEEDIANLFGQIALGPSSSLQLELRASETEQGDLPLRFDPDNFSSHLQQEEEILSPRLGFHHIFSPGSELVASLIYQQADFDTRDSVHLIDAGMEIENGFDIEVEERGWLGEMQHHYARPGFRLISGLGHYTAKRDTEQTVSMKTSMLPPLPPISETTVLRDDQDEDVGHSNLYLYSLINQPEPVTWTVGLSADFFDGVTDREQVNPKLGAIWQPTESTTVRGAVFRVLKRSLLTDQTIEPVQVAGFNQFFDEGEGSRWWRYGLGLDQRFGDSVSTGIEWSERDMEVPYLEGLDSKEADWKEEITRLFCYWTPLDWLGLSAEYSYEQLDRDEAFPGPLELTEVDTHELALGASLFHRLGWFSRVTARFVDQEGTFERPASEVPPGQDQLLFEGSDDFWVLDLSLGYRLPNRLGQVQIGAKNVLDESFRYQDTDPVNPSLAPERLVYVKLSFVW